MERFYPSVSNTGFLERFKNKEKLSWWSMEWIRQGDINTTFFSLFHCRSVVSKFPHSIQLAFYPLNEWLKYVQSNKKLMIVCRVRELITAEVKFSSSGNTQIVELFSFRLICTSKFCLLFQLSFQNRSSLWHTWKIEKSFQYSRYQQNLLVFFGTTLKFGVHHYDTHHVHNEKLLILESYIITILHSKSNILNNIFSNFTSFS